MIPKSVKIPIVFETVLLRLFSYFSKAEVNGIEPSPGLKPGCISSTVQQTNICLTSIAGCSGYDPDSALFQNAALTTVACIPNS